MTDDKDKRIAELERTLVLKAIPMADKDLARQLLEAEKRGWYAARLWEMKNYGDTKVRVPFFEDFDDWKHGRPSKQKSSDEAAGE